MPKSAPEVVAEPEVAAQGSQPGTALANGAKLVGESFVPGASLLLDGEVVPGLVHTAVGYGARAALGAFGPVGMLVVAANSYSKSVTDRHLVDHLVGAVRPTQTQQAPASGSASAPAAST